MTDKPTPSKPAAKPIDELRWMIVDTATGQAIELLHADMTAQVAGHYNANFARRGFARRAIRVRIVGPVKEDAT